MMCAIFLHIAILYTFTRVCYMDIATYYIYMEACQGRLCYAVREINVTYNTKTQDIYLLCATPMPLDEEETLPRAVAKGTNAYETDIPYELNYTAYQSCNITTPLLLEFISAESHIISVSIVYQDFYEKQSNHLPTQESTLNSMLMNFQSNGSVNVITIIGISLRNTNVTFNETSSQCFIYEDFYKRACFCKENYAREYCLRHDYRKMDPIQMDFEYFHVYGRLTMKNLHYYYYFETTSQKGSSNILYIQRYSASALREAGGKESISLCVSYNGSATEIEDNSGSYCLGRVIYIPKSQHNFTVFAKLYDNEWHSLLWFDYLNWSKSYIPGNCSYKEQIRDDIVHPFAVCMRRNVTEKFYKNITQIYQTSSTLMITTDYDISESVTAESQSTVLSLLAPVLLDQEDIEEGLTRIAVMRNITEEIVNNVLSTLDTFLNSTQNVLQLNSSRILQSLNSIVKNSCCDIDFIGDWSLVVRRRAISCLDTDPNQWPTMNEIPKNSNFSYYEPKDKSYVFIEIPNETVCSEEKHQEYILIYYLFSNQMLFVENEKTGPENACESRKRTEQNTPVLSAQLIDKLSMETIHQIKVHKKSKLMAKIVFPIQPAAKLHGSTKLVYWEGERWVDAEASEMLLENDHNVYLTTHLTDFTLVVDGLEMDPVLCDVVLDCVSVMINFLSFVGLLILIGHLSVKRYLPDYTTKKDCGIGNLRKLPSKYEKTRLNYFVVLALFHLGFLLLSDSRNLFWPMSCDRAAMVLYWLLLSCILITVFQSLHFLKILASNSLLENLLIYVVGRKFVLFVTLGIPTIVVLILKITLPLFFDRQDNFCWIRPDYVVPGVVIPLGFLGLNSAFIFFLIFIRIASQGSFFGIYVTFGQSSVRTIISTSTASTRSVRSDKSSASLISNGAKYVEKTFTLLCIQLMLGIPWICQYLTLFAPQLTAAHYIFTIVIGSQGLLFFMLFCYRKIKSRYF